jgi:hypothetical protein
MSLDFAAWTAIQHFLLDLLAIVFIVSGIAKLISLPSFRYGLQLLPLMTAPFAHAVAVGLPIAELILGASMFANATWSKYAAIILLVLFSGVALLAMRLGRRVPCGCFGQLDGEILSWRTVVRNGFLIVVVAAVLGLQQRSLWLLTVWRSGLLLLIALSLLQLYRNYQLIAGLRKAKIL